MTSEKIFYKYQAVYADDNNYALSNLTNNILYFTDPANFNDPFDCKMYIDDRGTKEQWIDWFRNNGYAENIAEKEIKKFSRWEDGRISPKNTHYLQIKAPAICCFSEKRDIVLMWSHYANHHKGICLGFRAKECSAKVSDIKEYSIPLLTQGVVNFSGVFNKVDYYEKEIPLIEQFGNEDYKNKVAFDQLLAKHSDWGYEKEYRIINIDSNPKPESIPNPRIRDRIYEYPRECLKEVIFGCKITKEIAQLVYDKINKSNLDEEGNEITKYYEAKESKVKCEINIDPIPDIDIFINSRPEN